MKSQESIVQRLGTLGNNLKQSIVGKSDVTHYLFVDTQQMLQIVVQHTRMTIDGE